MEEICYKKFNIFVKSLILEFKLFNKCWRIRLVALHHTRNLQVATIALNLALEVFKVAQIVNAKSDYWCKAKINLFIVNCCEETY